MQNENNKMLTEDKIIGIINNFLHEEFEVELIKNHTLSGSKINT